MARIVFGPDIALPQYERLQSDDRLRSILVRVDRILDALEEDPGQAWLRSHRFQNPPLWYVPFPVAGEEWAILWSFDPTIAGGS